jgi:hypothetical protein
VKAYSNEAFLKSPDARLIRLLAEYLEPESRFRDLRIRDTVVFFGSARTLPIGQANQGWKEHQARIAGRTLGKEERLEKEKQLLTLRMAEYYELARDLSRKLTKWSMNLPGKFRRFVICSGGGPGIMEAANKGAQEAGGVSIGLNISLPFEQDPNPYVSERLSFEFHYFFMRKLWFVYLARALVIFPGGFGTMDEMMEVLTLVQTKKLKKKLPVVLFGSEYWNQIINFEGLIKWGMIDPEDLSLFKRIDDVDEAFEYLTGELTRLYLTGKQ